ncbi:MAG: hypothetical protein PHO63_00880 [Bacilli bacterium]|nr:hypothetical protein [Bacilli bacterium]MDD4809343.1 hypothetical protein [Bacilli bacterium]
MKKEKLIHIWKFIKINMLLIFIVFVLTVFINHNDTIKIIDKTKNCATALEQFYEDEHYIYYFPCIQSQTIYVKIYNNPRILVKDALKDNKIKISELKASGLKFYKEAKFELNIKSATNCEVKTIFEVDNFDYRIYSYCLDDVSLVFNNTFYSFQEALEKNKINIDQIFEKMEYDNEYAQTTKIDYDDEETIMYKNFAYSLLKCNTKSGNKDIYIGDKNLEYEDNFCK